VKLHCGNLSSSSRRVTLVVKHLGIDLEMIPVDLSKDRTQLTALNPNSKIPVLQDGDFVLWESHAIAEYLCAPTPGQTLLPVEPRARGDVQRWLFWSSAHFSIPLGGLAFEKLWKKYITGGAPDPARIAEHERTFGTLAKVLDGHLADRAWVAGKALTLADFSIAATLMYAPKLELSLEPYANLMALLGRVHELPAWKLTEPTW
jgi:glutathione S-transferase